MAGTQVVWSEALTKYDFGPGHPMHPIRLELTAKLIGDLGLFDHVETIVPDIASDEALLRVHEAAYIEAVKAASADPSVIDPARGIGTDDDPAFAGMHEAAGRIVDGTDQVVNAVWSGAATHGVNFSGGMHHAMAGSASGFCVYNDVAVAIQGLLDAGAERIAYVDVDVHHGDGVQDAFWNDPRVLTVSVHESARTLFPGTGWPTETGGPQAPGSAVNVALPPGTTDSGWLRAIASVADPAVRAFGPQLIVSQHGCDTHREDPLAHLAVTVDAQRQAAESLHRLAHEVADGKWVAVGGGGYEVVDVVPRSWTHLTAIAAHAPVGVEEATPQAWQDYVKERVGRVGPQRMGDLPPGTPTIWVQPWNMGYNPESPVDQAILATREAVFPTLGLDVWFD